MTEYTFNPEATQLIVSNAKLTEDTDNESGRLHLIYDPRSGKSDALINFDDICKALVSNTSISGLALDFPFGENPHEAHLLAHALKKNNSIDTLFIDDLNISLTSLVLMNSALSANRKLHLQLRSNHNVHDLHAIFSANNMNANGSKLNEKPRVDYYNWEDAPIEPRSRLWNPILPKIEAISYVADKILPILENEKASLQYSSGANILKARHLKRITTEIITKLDSFAKNDNLSSLHLRCDLSAYIQSEIDKNNFKDDPCLAEKFGITLLNILILVTLIPVAVKRLATGSWFFSMEGRTTAAVKDALSMAESLPTIQISSP